MSATVAVSPDADDGPEALVVDPGDLLEGGRPAEDPLEVGCGHEQLAPTPRAGRRRARRRLTKVAAAVRPGERAASRSPQVPAPAADRGTSLPARFRRRHREAARGFRAPRRVSAQTRRGSRARAAGSRLPPGCVTNSRPLRAGRREPVRASPAPWAATGVRRDLAAPVEVAGVQGELELGRAGTPGRKTKTPPSAATAAHRSSGDQAIARYPMIPRSVDFDARGVQELQTRPRRCREAT